MIDIFNDDAFSVIEMTEAINTVPYEPKRIGQMGIFDEKFPRVNVAFLERRGDMISLLPTKVRGSGETTKRPARRRDMVPIMIPHIPYDDAVLPEDLTGIREYDTEDQLVAVSGIVNDKLTDMRRDHETTHEFHRIGAIKGQVLDADEDLSVLVDLFEAFNIDQEEFYLNLEGDGEDLKATCLEIIGYYEDRLGGETYDHIHAMVGLEFFKALIFNQEVKEVYSAQNNERFRMEQQGGRSAPGKGTSMVEFGDIVFECYRGKVGDVNFIEPDAAHFFPFGVSNLFQSHFGPANTMTDVNKPGKKVFARTQPKDFDEGMDIRTESNHLAICRRPKLLVLGHSGASSS